MSLLLVIFLAAVQGFTEFFPISSSGHLVFFQNLFGINESGIALDIFLHTGTLLAVLFILRKEVVLLFKGFFRFRVKDNDYGRLAYLIIAANIPAGIAGILFKDRIEYFFGSSFFVFIFLIFTGIYLFLSRYFRDNSVDLEKINIVQALVIGLSQMLAVFPGVSRSGITIVTGMMMKLKREDSARFSFLIMLPAVAGATLLELIDMAPGAIEVGHLAAGIAVSFITGYIAIKALLKILSGYRLHYFAYYCIIAGVSGLIFAR
ncbi:MAG: undecaprenyl-diphosphate phosphatase [Elusimicrobia bacterium]|nr:undecaprenyl-diphosphate phosphatase [Elusimicrobiota bacterium]